METLKFIADQMNIIGIPYEFGEWTSDIEYPYFVGENTESEPTTEDGLKESAFLLTGFMRGKSIELEKAREKIEKHFHPIYGLRGQLNDGAIAVFYGGASHVPTGEADLKKIQINLNIKRWKGDL